MNGSVGVFIVALCKRVSHALSYLIIVAAVSLGDRNFSAPCPLEGPRGAWLMEMACDLDRVSRKCQGLYGHEFQSEISQQGWVVFPQVP